MYRRIVVYLLKVSGWVCLCVYTYRRVPAKGQWVGGWVGGCIDVSLCTCLRSMGGCVCVCTRIVVYLLKVSVCVCVHVSSCTC